MLSSRSSHVQRDIVGVNIIHSAAVFILLMAVYLYSMPSSITLEDAGLFQMVCLYNGLAHPPGYPLFTLICLAFSQISWLDPVISGNLISALFAALAGALIFNVVPTFREVETIGNLILAVDRVMEDADLRYELLVVDDDSQDGTDQVVAELGSNYPVLLIDRKGKIRDLSESVLDGISEAANDIVVGSRYVSGGSFDREWNFWRFLNSWAATRLLELFMGVGMGAVFNFIPAG